MSIFLFLFAFLFTQPSWAFKLSLGVSTLELAEGMYATTATIVNTSKNMIAIEAGARIRTYSRDGVESFEQSAEHLIIIPSQMIIPPESEQVLSIRWTGPREIPQEKAYRLLIEYVSVSEDKLKGETPQTQQAGININYRIAKSFYVSPKGAKADILLQKVTKQNIEDKEMLQLSFQNLGTKHQIVHGLEVAFTTQAQTPVNVSFNQEVLGGSINFLAQEPRDVLIPCPESLIGQEILEAKVVGYAE